MTEPTARTAEVSSGDPTLPALVTRLGEQILTLVDSKLSLFKIELQEDVAAYGRNVVSLAVAGMIGAVGFALLNVALALMAAYLLDPSHLSPTMQHAGGFAATGLTYLVAGGAIANRAWHRLTRTAPTP